MAPVETVCMSELICTPWLHSSFNVHRLQELGWLDLLFCVEMLENHGTYQQYKLCSASFELDALHGVCCRRQIPPTEINKELLNVLVVVGFDTETLLL